MTHEATILVVLAFVAGGTGAAALALGMPWRRPGRWHRKSDAGPGVLEANHSAEARMSALASQVLGAMDVGVIVVDRDEIAILANRTARAMRVVENDRLTMPVLQTLVRTVTDTGEPASATLDLAASLGGPEILTFLVSAMPLDASERVANVLLRFSDITESRRLERVRRDFVANVSHELKTPVGALTLLAEAVQDASDDPEAVQRFAHRMQREGARLGRLVQELIELSRLQGAEPLPGQHLVSVEDILSEAVDRSRLAAAKNCVTVVDRTEPWLQVRGNETQLATAVANLVDNAIAYSPEQTKVGVSARSAVDPDGSEWVEIAVTDQGIGIAEADLDRVFERFFRVDQARSRATGGTGLGLAIVKHIASNHGGVVTVWSVPGSGSTFTVRLPLAGRGSVRAVTDDAVRSDGSAAPESPLASAKTPSIVEPKLPDLRSGV